MSDETRGRASKSAAGAGVRHLLAVFGLVIGFLVVEVAGGLLTNSLALLADAGHMLTDAAGLGLALLAIWFARRPASAAKTYGYYRMEIFAAVGNAVILFGVAGFILYEAIQRLAAPPEVIGLPMLAVAVIGLVVNLVSMRLLHSGAQESLNLRGAYLEVLGDLLGSVAVIVAAVVILLTGWTPIDPIVSVVIAALILPRTWTLLREAVDILLQATPRGVDLDEVRDHIRRAPGVVDTHDLHAWTLTSGMHVVSAHVVIERDAEPASVLDELCACLADDFDFEHSTIQLETTDRRRIEAGSHP
ncbi:MAG TPA: cation diffusion facilitator family transporter [Candidatus Limnocylindria bacterium]|jgi:cobalt-zinc-cadmium efflux system protein|nr:cation diffusion facilitator family transporter [Candidatus Limnocylindria bacterium]